MALSIGSRYDLIESYKLPNWGRKKMEFTINYIISFKGRSIAMTTTVYRDTEAEAVWEILNQDAKVVQIVTINGNSILEY